jgi:hypothetical protein
VNTSAAFVIVILQVNVVELAQNLPPRIVLSRASMTERPAAFQLLPYMELSDPEAGWSNVTITLLVTPLDSQLEAPVSSFKLKRWTPWDMPQATVRNSNLQSSSNNENSHFVQDVSIRHTGYPGYIHRKTDCLDIGMPPVSVSVEGPNSDGNFLSSMLFR